MTTIAEAHLTVTIIGVVAITIGIINIAIRSCFTIRTSICVISVTAIACIYIISIILILLYLY